jgi:hypothetical protein
MSKNHPSSIILVPLSYGRESSCGLPFLKKGVAHKAFALCGARYYDPDVALWISVDPARQFWSPYAYGSNPVNGTDPDGREWGGITSEGLAQAIRNNHAEGAKVLLPFRTITPDAFSINVGADWVTGVGGSLDAHFVVSFTDGPIGITSEIGKGGGISMGAEGTVSLLFWIPGTIEQPLSRHYIGKGTQTSLDIGVKTIGYAVSEWSPEGYFVEIFFGVNREFRFGPNKSDKLDLGIVEFETSTTETEFVKEF